MAPAMQGAMQGVMGTLQSAGTASSGPTKRNAVMAMVVPFGVIVAGAVLGTILAFIVGFLGSLVSLLGALAGGALFILSIIKMVGELNTVTRNTAFPWWPIIVPIYGIYWEAILLPAEVTKAKQMMGVQTPTRNIVLYILLLPFALASDLNDMAK
jgi:hypothetical protein